MSAIQIPSSSAGGDLLDDVFGSSPEEPASIADDTGLSGTYQTSLEPSELPSLRRQHVTSGYRDAVSSAKNEHVQAGFDAGYPVGAQIGLRVGTVLGILEGIIAGLETNTREQKQKTIRKMNNTSKDATGQSSLSEEDRERITQQLEQLRKLHRRAVSELRIESLFGATRQLPPGDDGSEWKKPEAILASKADPIVRRWEEIIRVTKWEENLVAVDELEDHENA
ncbi:hypothetical protein VTN49DRAFT_1886 [Thermomyces lanuginosus]|uniref:uncharacterized protein n=1 Tax=Thermomyces lanuginosus TaxID=5541 RepID=UPI0037430218